MMAASLETRPSLLMRMRDPADQAAWRQFVDTYGPLIYRYARRRGLQDSDAADLTQTVLWQLCESVSRFEYDPRRGTFRSWLFEVVRRQWCKNLERQRRHVQGRKQVESLDHLAADPSEDELKLWESEYQRRLFESASNQVREMFAEATWQAFWQTAVEGHSAHHAAGQLGMSVGAVYTAKSRVLDRLREVIAELNQEWDEA